MAKSRGAFLKLNDAKLKKANVTLKNLRSSITSSDEVVVSASGWYFQKMQSRVAQIVSDMRWYIREDRSNVTETGRKRKAAGGAYAGRSESDEMARAFTATKGGGVTKLGKNHVKFHADIGWVYGMPQYTLFQEMGTFSIRPMNALMRLQQEIEWTIKEELTSNREIGNLAKDIRGALLASLSGQRFGKPQALKSEAWRQVLSGKLDPEGE